MNDIIDARIVGLRQQRKPNGRHLHTTSQIAAIVSAQFGITITPGTVKYRFELWRAKLTPEERDAQCIKSQVKGVKPMPPSGTKMQCRGCGHAYWAPGVPSRCLHCPTILRSGERLAAGCEEWREPEL